MLITPLARRVALFSSNDYKDIINSMFLINKILNGVTCRGGVPSSSAMYMLRINLQEAEDMMASLRRRLEQGLPPDTETEKAEKQRLLREQTSDRFSRPAR